MSLTSDDTPRSDDTLNPYRYGNGTDSNPYGYDEDDIDYYLSMINYKPNVVEDLMNPGRQQEKEFGQQILMQRMQNRWNSAQEQMKRADAAGINKNLAAAGIAGGNASPSVSGPSSSAVGAGADSVGKAIDAAATAGNLATGGLDSVVNAVDKLTRLPAELENLDADTRDKLEQAGYTAVQSRAAETSLKYLDEKERVGIDNMLANIDNLNEQRKLYAKQRQWYDEDIRRIEEELELIDQRTETEKWNTKYQEWLAKTQEQIQAQEKFISDIQKQFGLDPSWPLSNMFVMAWLSGDEAKIKALTDSYDSYVRVGEKGKNEMQATYGQVNNKYAAAQQVVLQAVEDAKTFKDIKDSNDAIRDRLFDLSLQESNKTQELIDMRLWWCRYLDALRDQYDGSVAMDEAIKEAEMMVSAPNSVYRERYPNLRR